MITAEAEALHLQVNTTKERFSSQLPESMGLVQITLILTAFERDPPGLLSPTWR